MRLLLAPPIPRSAACWTRGLRAGLACLLATLACASSSGASTPSTSDLIPAPRRSERLGAGRALSAGLEVISDAPRADAYAIRLLETSCAAPGNRSRGARPAWRCVHLRAARPPAIPSGAIADQSYALETAGDTIRVTGPTAAARLYGVETLRQLALLGNGHVPALRILDGPALRLRGLSLDVSRGRMPTYDDLLRTLDLCAGLKLNLLHLYFEDTFEYSRVSAEARSAHGLSPLTLRRLTAEARRRSIELVPIVQTLAHQERLLAHPSMRRYSELHASPPGWDAVAAAWERVRRASGLGAEHDDPRAGPASGMFAITRPAVRSLVGSMVDDVLSASGAHDIHLGCDEPAELGLGASAGEVRRRGADAVFLDHVRALADRARERWGARAWIFADMVRAHPGLAAGLPRDLVLVDWDYDPASTFASLDTLAAVGPDRVLTSAGLWNWRAIYPDHAKAHANIEAATGAARSRGCLGSVLASWGDGGAEDLFGNDVLGTAYFAELAWRDPPGAFAAFLPRYCRLRFGSCAVAVEHALDPLVGLCVPNGSYNQRILYRPILVRRRTPSWRDAMAMIHADMERGRAGLRGATGRDLYADAELEALRVTLDRFVAATGREQTLDTLAAFVETASSADAAGRTWAVSELERLGRVESSAQADYVRAWRAHNEESELGVIRSRFSAQLRTLDSLRLAAARGGLRAGSARAAPDHGHTRRSTAGSARSAPRMNTVSGRTAGIQ